MNTSNKTVRALGLLSGGLDSMLAGLILRDQGIEVEFVTFETPFFNAKKGRKASQMTGIPLTVKQIYPVYIKMLKNPPAGYGKHMNPCMDCHALMFRLAGEMMEAQGFDFLFSGEVVGQRPMSQNKSALRYVEKYSGFEGYILRPLSARNLPQTMPEKEGLVNRELLLDIEGRSRKRQIQLATKFGITEYPAPAGGCLLTDQGYSNRLKDLFDHQQDCTEAELHLLKYGRHFRLNPEAKLIVGRTQNDNERILKYHNPEEDIVMKVNKYAGPIAVIPHGAKKDAIFLAASICTGYSKAPDFAAVEVRLTQPKGKEVIKVIGIPPEDVRKLLIT
ncbi:MAG: tRNA 4-thiouridine(8) synthase ThiI [Desulfobacterales bacterium]|jgi:tRNA U34 2-thiouridine synthase MnmA/TrmU